MNKLLRLVVLFAMFGSQAQKSVWTPASTGLAETLPKVPRQHFPRTYGLFRLDLDGLKEQLQGLPVRGQFTSHSAHIIELPDANGKLQRYDVIETPIMEPGLQAKFPMIRSYAAQGIDDPTAVARFSVTQFGLHSMTLSGSGNTVFIDPYTEDRSYYIVYNRDALEGPVGDFRCLTDDGIDLPSLQNRSNNPDYTIFNTDDKKLRTYRLAQSCNGEYASIFKGTGTTAQQKANVQAQMAITMTRVNGVYEKDLAITMIFVANNDLLIYLDPATDPWTSEFNTMTAQTIDAVIGVNNYDIGHNFNTTGGGNAGCIGCVCSSTSQSSFHKGRGYTGRSNPTGDAFDIDYVAHEMGHQFGGYHTQSSNNCRSGNQTEVEPGSGSTIMGYAGICAANVQNNSDAYFAYVNIRDILLNVKSGVSSSCAQLTPFANNPPVVNAGADYTIPKSTPFQLTATGADPDGNTLTYCWEQRDPEAVLPTTENTAAPSVNRTAGPMFRSLTGATSPSRYFPGLSTILAGQTTNTWEVLPATARTLNFSVVARDNVAGGGQTASDLMVLTVSGTAGPFLVTSPNTAVSWGCGTNQDVTWDVAGTTANGVNCAYVDIWASSDNGATFPRLLAAKVPNDGSETISVPNTVGTTNRVMVRGYNNVFLDVSNTAFTTTAAPASFLLSFSGLPDGQNKSVCQGANASFDLTYTPLGGFSGTTNFSVTGNPAGSTVSFSQASMGGAGTNTLTLSNTTNSTPGLYALTVTGTSGALTRIVKFYVEIQNAAFGNLALNAPADQAFAQPVNLSLSWIADPAATSYQVQVATDADFNSIITNTTVSATTYALAGLQENKNYFWRVLPKNSGCSGVFSGIRRFTTGQTNCNSFAAADVPLVISATGTPTINSTITVPVASNVTISDVNVAVNITHSWVADLTLTLISPGGTQIQLVAQKCSSNDNIVATFDDAGLALVCGTNPAVTGSVVPAQPLSVLNGQNSQGTWTLRVSDGASQDGGSLVSWRLDICSSASQPLACGVLTSTWNGSSWSNGTPVDNVAAVINANYVSVGDLKACSLTVNNNAQVTIQAGHNFTITGGISVAPTAQLTVESNANLVQVNEAANTGKIQVRRNAMMRRLDYVYWSSPVATQNLHDFSPLTLKTRFYVLNEAANGFAWIDPLTNAFAPGKGYSIRAPDNFPTTPAVFSGQFEGVANNGLIQTPVTINGQGYNLVGNPYPSTINAYAFLTANPGALYFWTHTTQGAAPGANYASLTALGATASVLGGPTPNGTIQVGQGFIIQKNSAGNAVFNNTMRVRDNQGQFFRTEGELAAKHRIWVNLEANGQPVNQILLGYMEGATSGFDTSIDAKQLSPMGISSVVAGQPLVIQGRGLPFADTDAFPLSLTVDQAGTYSLGLDHADGIFAENQAVYLKDQLQDVVWDWADGPYSFVADAGTSADRFSVVFQSSPLGVAAAGPVDPKLQVYVNDNGMHIQCGTQVMQSVRVYDLRGRLLFESQPNASSETIRNLRAANQLLLVKVTDTQGRKYSQKVAYRK